MNLRRRVLGLEPQSVKPLDTKQAMEVATGVIGEVILFTMAGAAVYWEWARYDEGTKRGTKRGAKRGPRGDQEGTKRGPRGAQERILSQGRV